MNFLFIAFEYPPMTTGGAQRPARLARALVAQGHGVAVVTTGSEPNVSIEEGVYVYRVPANPAGTLSRLTESSWISLTDGCGKRWRRNLLAALPEIVARHSPDVLWVTVPPFGVAKLGVEVAKRFSLPFIFDMRDAWSQWGIAPFPTRWHYEALLKLERTVLNAADSVCVTTDQMRHDVLRVQPLIHPRKIKVIPNGYEGSPVLYERIDLRKPTAEAPLTIGYVGSFYYTPQRHRLMVAKWYHKKPHQWLQYSPRKEDWKYRSPYYVFQAFAGFKAAHPELAKRIRFEFVGAVPKWLNEMVTAAGLEEHTVFHGAKQHNETLAFIDQCDVVLATSVKVLGGNDYCIAGKTYEYIQRCKPVLGFVTKGAQRDFLQASGLLIQADPDDAAAGRRSFEALVSGTLSLTPNAAFIQSCSITNRASALISKAIEVV